MGRNAHPGERCFLEDTPAGRENSLPLGEGGRNHDSGRMRGGRGCRFAPTKGFPSRGSLHSEVRGRLLRVKPSPAYRGWPRRGRGWKGSGVIFGPPRKTIGPTSVSPGGLPPSPQGEGFPQRAGGLLRRFLTLRHRQRAGGACRRPYKAMPGDAAFYPLNAPLELRTRVLYRNSTSAF